jgi:hypothetical protein
MRKIPTLLRSIFTIDVRSLSLFRILLGAFFLYDIVSSRLFYGAFDIAWYTSIPAERSYLMPDDTPHKAPLHQLWFYRGTVQQQYILFGASMVLSSFFMMGYKCNGFTKIVLWILQVSQMSRCMPVSDGSDSYCRHLLLWSCFLPMSSFLWSVDSLQRVPVSNSRGVFGVATMAILLQMVLMYEATVFHRAFDNDPATQTGKKQWLPPELSAVYYALSGDFSSRAGFSLVQSLRNNPEVSQFMTAGAMVMESGAPLLCLLGGNSQLRLLGALLLFLVHAGLLVCFNLPNWQILGMISHVLWIPTCTWDFICQRLPYIDPTYLVQPAAAVYEKTNMKLTPATASLDSDDRRLPCRLRSNPISLVLQYFFLLYMLYNWCGNRGWIAKHDHGDIGEGLRLSQYWVMFASVGQTAHNIHITGTYRSMNSTQTEVDESRIDVLHYIKYGNDKPQDSDDFIEYDMTSRYPSPRWERALHQWTTISPRQDKRRKVMQHMGNALCLLLNEHRLSSKRRHRFPPLERIDMRIRDFPIIPPSKLKFLVRGESRYVVRNNRIPEFFVSVGCPTLVSNVTLATHSKAK